MEWGLGNTLGASLAKGFYRLMQRSFQTRIVAQEYPIKGKLVGVSHSDGLVYRRARDALLVLIIGRRADLCCAREGGLRESQCFTCEP